MMKKDITENKSYDFIISENSINIVNNIIGNMEGKSFHNHYHILYDICNSLDGDDIIYFEIGCFAGASASLMSTNQKVSKCYSLDIGVPIDKQIPIRNVNKFKHENCQYEYIHGSSLDSNIIKYVKEKINEIDILFIDGDHRRNAVISDFENYSPLVKKNGYIVFDDYLDFDHSPDVHPAVNEIVEKLDKDKFEIIGSLEYDLLEKTNFKSKKSNEFIIKKL